MKNLVSIIIPNYNRAHLILDTLESIRKQSYTHWECIIVDDHSTDKSVAVISAFIQKDFRFSLYHRPESKAKGANSCRNYGFIKSQGNLIQWFDSDDIMVKNHLDCLVNAIEKNNVDFAIGDSMNFVKGKGLTGKPYNFNRGEASITANNFGKQSIGWITDDFLGKRSMFNNIKFNESIKTDGDEYNFFTQLLHENNNGIFLNKVLTYRRIHSQSLSNQNVLKEKEFEEKIATIKIVTCKDIEKYGDLDLILWFIKGYMQFSFGLSVKRGTPPFLMEAFFKILRYMGKRKAAAFVVAIFSGKLFGRGYIFLKAATG